MEELKIAIIQYNIIQDNKNANFSKIEEAVHGIRCDLIVLPEVFQTGFCVENTWHAEPMDGRTIEFLKHLANTTGAVVCGSFFCMANRECVNRFVALKNDEIICTYDKVHLFKMGNEHQFITPGSERAHFEVNGFSIRPIVCYDLRFPYICYNDTNYDVLLCPANWPSKRIRHWDALLEARAIENQAYVIGANRIGECGGMFYPGHSSVFNPKGERVAFSYKKSVIEYTLHKKDIEATRSQLPFLDDAVELF